MLQNAIYGKWWGSWCEILLTLTMLHSLHLYPVELKVKWSQFFGWIVVKDNLIVTNIDIKFVPNCKFQLYGCSPEFILLNLSCGCQLQNMCSNSTLKYTFDMRTTSKHADKFYIRLRIWYKVNFKTCVQVLH
jgi:hypothetical protein